MGTRPVTRAQYHHGALRQELIAGAREILAERGHDQFSINELARRVGVSTSAPYRHFANRDELLTAVADEGYMLLVQRLETATATRNVGERLLRLGGAYVRFAHDHPDLFAVMFRSRPITDPVAHRSFDIVVAAVGEAQGSGVISARFPADLMARSIWAAVHGIAVLSLRPPHERFDLHGAAEDLAAQTLTALLGLDPDPIGEETSSADA